jgi:SAM-dependent methyltransferase
MRQRPGDTLMGANRTAAGRRVFRLERRRIPFLAMVDRPVDFDVVGHTGKVARFGGWVGSSVDGPYTVRAFVDGREPIEQPIDLPCPGVIERFPRPGMAQVRGFSLFIDLPPLEEPLGVSLELTDGRHAVRTQPYRIMPDNNLMSLDTYIGDTPAHRRLSLAHLRGRGLEFGALHSPVPVDPSCAMQYADKLTKAESFELFYDMREEWGAQMVEVDHVVDLDRDDLGVLAEHDFDFFVAAGVIEHLVNPLRFLENLHRVMKPGARFLLSAPDRDFTWDVGRELTTNEHLYDEYVRGEVELSEEHLIEYIQAIPHFPWTEEEPHRSNLLTFHRDRTIHVHVWDEASFDDFLRFANERLGLTFEVVERASSREGIGNVVYVLRKGG